MIGWLGSLFFGICGFPQAWECYTTGHGRGLSHYFLLCWALGEIFTLIYVVNLPVLHWPLIANYLVNLASLVVIFKYKYFPRTM